LRDNVINDLKSKFEGKLADHYNPGNKTINLSREVNEGRSIAAAAVVAMKPVMLFSMPLPIMALD
jgi:Zn-dependent membrane protease YugP